MNIKMCLVSQEVVLQKYSYSFGKAIDFHCSILPSTYLRRIENACFPLWTLESTVGQFPVVPEVCLLDRPVPSNGEKGQSEALGFLNFGGGGIFDFLYSIF